MLKLKPSGGSGDSEDAVDEDLAAVQQGAVDVLGDVQKVPREKEEPGSHWS